MLLVTHDIDEAILVADRILLMGGKPGNIVREWTVDIAQPRISHGTGVVALKMDILDALQSLQKPQPAVPL